MLLSQVLDIDGSQCVAARDGSKAAVVLGAVSTYGRPAEPLSVGLPLSEVIAAHGSGEAVDLLALAGQGRLALPISHPDPAHAHLTDTGLTHLRSASIRDEMHAKLDGAEMLADSMRMFKMGLEGGRPRAGEIGVQPERFYKGNRHTAVACGQPLTSPGVALDGGEEPEIAGIYLIGADGTPARVGWELANEFSDHVTERINYLYLAHSKLCEASFGPEILVGDLPSDVRGISRVWWDGAVVFEAPFQSREANMSHTVANLGHHHFKYPLFRQPGDLHVHMFGTATLRFAAGLVPQAGDVFEIEAAAFGLPLRNPLAVAHATPGAEAVKQL
jgi:hypothetical protein